MSSGARTSAKVSEVAEAVNTERKDLGQDLLTDRKVGGILRSMGYAPKRMTRGYFIILTPMNVGMNV
jgi:hypothetical protein